jgi:hypothetical protein
MRELKVTLFEIEVVLHLRHLSEKKESSIIHTQIVVWIETLISWPIRNPSCQWWRKLGE